MGVSKPSSIASGRKKIGLPPYLEAVRCGHVSVLRTMHQLGINVHNASHIGRFIGCPFSYAFNYEFGSIDSRVRVIRLLVDLGGDLEYNQWRCRPVENAIGFVDAASLRCMVSCGAAITDLPVEVSDQHIENLATIGTESSNSVRLGELLVLELIRIRECWTSLPGTMEEQQYLFALCNMVADTHALDLPAVGATPVPVVSTCRAYAFDVNLVNQFARDGVSRAMASAFAVLPYPARRRLMVLSGRVLRRSPGAVVHLYQLVSLFMNAVALNDLLNLRLTCRCCEVERRLPISVSTSKNRVSVSMACSSPSPPAGALEAGLIESFIAGEAAYFVPTRFVAIALTLFQTESTDQRIENEDLYYTGPSLRELVGYVNIVRRSAPSTAEIEFL